MKKKKNEESKKVKKIRNLSKNKTSEENIYDFNIENGEKNIEFENEDVKTEHSKSKRNILKISIFTLIAIAIIILIARYVTDSDFREMINLNILGKEVTDENLETIEINSDENPTIFSYGSYIAILSESVLDIYNSNATNVASVEINVSTPIVQTNGNYIVVAEDGGSNFYVLNNTAISWQGSVDGNISKININQNGYVSVIISNSSYNSIVILYNSDGTELFKTYLPSTYAMCSSVSTDNSYLAIGEIDYSGTVLKSNIRIMDIETAEKVYSYSTDNNNIIIDIEYADKENAICEFTDSIVSVSSSEGNEIYTVTDDTCFMDIGISGVLTVLEKQSSGLFSYEYNLKIINLSSNAENLYILNNSLPQELEVNGKLIALNYGNEVEIVSQSGTLKKKYTSTEQIKDVVVGNDIAGIIYKDKIVVIDL